MEIVGYEVNEAGNPKAIREAYDFSHGRFTKSYCMNCKKEVSNDTKKCECGGTYFVYGENFKFTGKNIVCNCGSDKFKKGTHMDFTYKAVTNHICSNCGNQIQTESFRRWIIY